MIWERNDMVTGEPVPAEIPVENGCVLVPIPLDAYKRLVTWASVGRSIDGAVVALTESTAYDEGDDPTMEAVEELQDLKQALDSAQQACRSHWRTCYDRSK